jgi:hypothetical protein
MAVLAAVKMLLVLQATQPTVAGTIRDGESGEPLAQAIVALADLDRSMLSDTSGRYRFLSVPAGPQHLTVRRVGYAPRTLDALVPGEGELEINIALRPMPMRLPPIVVRSTVALRGLESGDSTPFPDRGVSMAAARNDPRLAEPDGLLALGGGEIGTGPESPSGFGAPPPTRPRISSMAFRSSIPIMPQAPSAPGTPTRSNGSRPPRRRRRRRFPTRSPEPSPP